MLVFYSSSDCPPKESIYPCSCKNFTESRLHCIGKHINDENLASVLSKKNVAFDFELIYIQNTSVENLTKHHFGLQTFKYIYMSDNSELSQIDPMTFVESFNRTILLSINRCPQISLANIINLVNHFLRLNTLDLSSNFLTEIPTRAFQPKNNSQIAIQLQIILLGNNNITSIGSFAFFNLTNLISVQLINNKINKIQNNGLTIGKSIRSYGPNINLSNNNLTSKSFSEKSIENVNDSKLHIYLLNNPIDFLPQNVFKPYVHQKLVTLNFDRNNNITCDCKMKWIMELDYKEKSLFKSLYCKNLDKFIKEVKSYEIGRCTNESDYLKSRT